MYGTVAELQVLPGHMPEVEKLLNEDHAMHIPGMVGDYLYRLDSDPNRYILAVMFESKDAYWANARSSEQHVWYEKLRKHLAADPEWKDGEIVWNMADH